MNQKSKQRYCNFCVNKTIFIDYKNTELLKRYISSFARIVPRKRSGVCARHQREIAQGIKLARIMALLPFVHK